MQSLRQIVGEGYLKVRCPNPEHLDDDPSYVIYANQGICFGCGFRETPEQIMERTGGVFEEPVRTKKSRSITKTENLEGHINFWHDTLINGPRQTRIQFLRDNYALSKRTIETYKLGHSGDYFTIPIWNSSVPVGVKKRADPKFTDPDAPKYLAEKGDQLFRRFPGRGTVIICEGELDAITVSQYGYDTVANTTGSGSLPITIQTISRSLSGVPVYTCTDMDSAGDKCYEGIREVIPHTKRLRFDGANDVGELLSRTDVGDRSEVLRLLIRKAQP